MPAWSHGPTKSLPGRRDSVLHENDPLPDLSLWRASGLSHQTGRSPSKAPRSKPQVVPFEGQLMTCSTVASNAQNSNAPFRPATQHSMETPLVLSHRPVNFISQQKLFTWIEQSQQQDLARVRTLSLRLTDIDLSPLLAATSSSGGGETESAWGLYNTELERLDGALRCLPGLEHLTIVPPSRNKSSLLRGIYRSFLSQIPKRCLKLQHLIIHDFETLLETVPELKNVRKVDFEEPTTASSLSRSPNSLHSRMMADKGKAKDAVVKMEVDTDDG
ncbi:hypothetical protein HII31_06755 [Pseudocercospora fuligena]|uniref:Uncharacterized protein n=1 Tax=Pseudocercospora fuligena TaxID=685502 RepID=A0A8H6VMB5_9PEZI|nr:hypothetical protein HII31_06755 [Pseudocercospora fuligena]